ncbi:MFS transporter [Methylocapsa sp. S129]|uniref:MFS transporter n=1 Tax=Methylocapsa sp. S129 TaxID=1641869 RepID=UPI00131E5E9D|nr:MFS transporter [Methylocapsa sp. S129]
MTIATAAAAKSGAAEKPVSAGMTFLLAAACGLTAANIYYAQPLIGLIAPAVGLGETAASLIVTVTQVGYGIGLVLLVPLGDLVENRSLTFWTLCAAVVALLAAAFAPSAPMFLAAALLIGIASVAAQMLLPIAAHLAPDATRGRTIGNVMSGLLLGIMLARPISSLIADAFGWRAVFGVSALAIAALAFALRGLLPRRRPKVDHGYVALIASMWALLRDTPLLRRRAAYQAALFAAFSLYWTAVPLELAGPTFGLSQRGIALFALAGAGGALSAPVVGRIADRGWGRASTGVSMAVVAVAFLLARIGGHGSMIALLAAGILLDAGVQGNQVVGQRVIYGLGAEARSRLNGLYIAIFFVGGAVGSSIASLAYTLGGWERVSWIGLAFPLIALLLFATEFRRPAD